MKNSNNDLTGKVSVVVGAGRGIGRAIATGFAEAGSAICCAARTDDEIENTLSEIEKRGGKGIAVKTDVTKPDSVENMINATARDLGGIDILVVSAGFVTPPSLVENSNPDNWKKILDVNLLGAYNCARSAIPLMKTRGAGKIIMIGSGVGHRGSAGNAAYAASKAGLWMLTRILAQELQQYRICVNEIIPGPVDTTLLAELMPNRNSQQLPENAWLKSPDEVVPMALFLATQPEIGPTAQSFSLMRRE